LTCNNSATMLGRLILLLEVLRIRLVVMITPTWRASCRCFRSANLPRGTRGSRLCSEDRDRESENSKVCARTRDTRVIQVRVAKVADPTSCLGDQVWRPTLGVVPQRDCGSPARYPALLYILQGAGSVVWTSLGPLHRWVPGPTTRWAPGTTRLALHGT
jgi:hypothetical protein